MVLPLWPGLSSIISKLNFAIIRFVGAQSMHRELVLTFTFCLKLVWMFIVSVKMVIIGRAGGPFLHAKKFNFAQV